MKSRIGVQTLIGQNEEPFLIYALRSVSWADYFVVVNTAPESYWGKINKELVEECAKEMDVPLRYCDFEPDEKGHFSFAEARNQAILMSDLEDFIFIVDSDDVHYPEWQDEVEKFISEGADSITAHYYHLNAFKNIFHFSAPREIIYKNYYGTQWVKGVHEQLINEKRWPVVSGYHYIHYGYIKPQSQIFDRWKFYSDLEGDYDHYSGQDPNNIISDRISVSKPLPVPHPALIQDFLTSYPECPQEALKDNWETVPVEKVGLVLLTHNDREYLEASLRSLAFTRTYPNFEVLAIDLASTDGSLELLESYKELLDMQIYEVGELVSLTESLNFGFNHFRQRHDIQYIGWIHPDMLFDNSDWLYMLWKELQDHPKIGKICAANTRDQLPNKLIEAHEQCFIIRKDVINKVGLFDENYIGIGGYEDWDFNRRIINHDSYKVMVSPRAQVYHKGMATRSRRDTTRDQVQNAEYYQKKWNTSDAPV